MAGKGCPMCAALGKGDNDFWVSVSTGEVAEVHLERRSRLPGYCIVVWRHGHVAEPGDLDRFRRAGTGLRFLRRDGRSRHDSSRSSCTT
jgi:hypothetical protein